MIAENLGVREYDYSFLVTNDIHVRFLEAHYSSSDINLHLPLLYSYAKECKHITEFGVRTGNSSWAFLAAFPEKFVGYDIVWEPEVQDLIDLAAEYKINYHYILGDTLEVTIEETDFLFIDTIHNYDHLKKELELHASQARKYIGFHDTERHKDQGHEIGIKGIMPAINEFLAIHKEWKIVEQKTVNNGLMIIKR